MEMQRYIKHAAGWWWITAACMVIAICCMVKAVQVERYREAMEPSPLLVGEEQAGDYSYIDVMYMTDLAYQVTDRSGSEKVFYFAGDADGYVYLVRLSDAQHAEFAAISGELPVPVRLTGVLCTCRSGIFRPCGGRRHDYRGIYRVLRRLLYRRRNDACRHG